MAYIAIFRINYKSDFILTLQSDAGWATPFCIKFWTGAPAQAYFVGYDGTTYTHCATVVGDPTKLTVQFDDHHLPIGDLKFQIGYHFTVADFPTAVEDEVINQAAVIIDQDDTPMKVMLDFQGETAPEIQFSLPAYANEAQRIANEQQRIADEQERIEKEEQRIIDEETRQADEAQRIAQETARVNEFATLKAQSQAATSAANTSAAIANEKAQLAADKAALAQQKADYAQTQGDYAKEQGDTALADHERAEADHAAAAADHTTAQADHAQAATDHTTAAADHTTAQADHAQAVSDHAAVEPFADSLGAYDISSAHASGGVMATYADLTDALGTNGANIPEGIRKGGMSVKFVQSSDSKYVSYRLMSQTFSTTVTDWQGVDDVPTAGSENLVKSGGVKASEDAIVVDFSGLIEKDVFVTDGVPYYSSAGAPQTNANRYRTFLIKVAQGDVFAYNLTNTATVMAIAAFDSSKNIVVASSVVGGGTAITGAYTVPSGVSYVQFCYSNGTGYYVRKVNARNNTTNPTLVDEKLLPANSIQGLIDKSAGSLPFFTDTTIPYYISDGSAVYNKYRDKTLAIPVRQGEVFDYSIQSLTNTYIIAAFDASKNLIAASSVLGTGSVKTDTYTVPAGVSFLVFASSNNAAHDVVRRGSVKGDLVKEVQDIYDTIEINKNELGLSLPIGMQEKHRYSVNKDTGKFGSYYSHHVVIPVAAGQKVSIKRGVNTVVAFVKSYSTVSDGDTPDYATGESARWITEQPQVLTVPDDAKYIIVTIEAGGVDYTPSVFRIDDYDVIGGTVGSSTERVLKNVEFYENITSPYLGCIEELYIPENLLEGVDRVILVNGNHSIYLGALDSSNNEIWRGRLWENAENGKVMMIPCNNAGGNLHAGDAAGYIVFKDADTFNANSTTSSPAVPKYQINLEYCIKRWNPQIASKFTVGITIPDTVYAIVGDTLQIFHKSVIMANNYQNYSVVVACDYGKNYPRYFEYKPEASHVGTKTLTYMVFDNDNVLIAKKVVSLVIKAKPATSPVSAINILALGDSLYTDGTIVSELNRRLTTNTGNGTPINPTGLNLSNINFIGRREVAGIHQEASGGWGWKTFDTNDFKAIRYQVTGVQQLYIGDTYTIDDVPSSSFAYMTIREINVTDGTGNILCEVNGGSTFPEGTIPATGGLTKTSGNGDSHITYTAYDQEPGNPLWNESEGRVDFQYYSQQYCGGVDIDILMTTLGPNDMRSISDVDTKLEAYTLPLIRQYHSDYPNGKVLLGSLILQDARGGIGANSGASVVGNWYNLSTIYWYYQRKIIEVANSSEFSSYVIVTDTCGEFDCETSYPYREAQQNNRNAETEKLGTNGSHPVAEMRKLLSDAFYRCICSKILQ